MDAVRQLPTRGDDWGSRWMTFQPSNLVCLPTIFVNRKFFAGVFRNIKSSTEDLRLVHENAVKKVFVNRTVLNNWVPRWMLTSVPSATSIFRRKSVILGQDVVKNLLWRLKSISTFVWLCLLYHMGSVLFRWCCAFGSFFLRIALITGYYPNSVKSVPRYIQYNSHPIIGRILLYSTDWRA